MILRTSIFLLFCLLSVQLVGFAQTKQKSKTKTKKTNSKQKLMTQPKSDISSKPSAMLSQNQSNTKPEETKNLADYISFNYFSKETGFDEKLIIRTSAFKINLKSQGKFFPQLNLYLFYEAVLDVQAFEKTSDGKFVVKEAPSYAYLHILNKSEPNLTFDSSSDRLLWFNTDNSRLVFGTLAQEAIANYDPLKKSYSAVQLETIATFLANQDEITELLSSFESTNKIRKLSESIKVTGHLGAFEFELTELHKRVLKEFLEKIKSTGILNQRN